VCTGLIDWSFVWFLQCPKSNYLILPLNDLRLHVHVIFKIYNSKSFFHLQLYILGYAKNLSLNDTTANKWGRIKATSKTRRERTWVNCVFWLGTPVLWLVLVPELAKLIASFCVRPLGGGAILYLCVSRLAQHPFIKVSRFPYVHQRGKALKKTRTLVYSFPLQYFKQINGVILWSLRLWRRLVWQKDFNVKE
jgi:hypothetical protein